MQPQILFVICAKRQPLDRAHTGMTFSGNLCADSYETRRHLRLLDTPLRHIRDFSLLICCCFSSFHYHSLCETAENISDYGFSDFSIVTKSKDCSDVPTGTPSHFLGLQMFLKFGFDVVQRFSVLAFSICSLFTTRERHGTKNGGTRHNGFPWKQPNALI